MLQTLYNNFSEGLNDRMTAISGSISAELTAPLTAAMTIYIILYGWAIIRGSIQEPVMDFTLRGIKLAIIWSLVASAANYNNWVGDTIINGIPEFIERLTGGSGNLPSDTIMSMATKIAEEVQEEYGLGLAGSFYGYIMSLLVVGIAIPFAAIVFVFSLLVHFGLTLIAAIGPLFICFALFDMSRGWFFAWLGHAVNFGILKLLITVLTQVIVAFVGDVYSNFNPSDGIPAVSAFLVAMACGTIFFFLLPSIASALSAGAGASTGALQRVVERKLLGTRATSAREIGAMGSASRQS